MNNSYYGNYRTRTFEEIWETASQFIDDFNASPFNGAITTDNLNLLYYLLYSRYAGSSIASSNENQFAYKCFSIIFTDGPKWEKRLEIQEKIKNLSEEDILAGPTRLGQNAYNPGQLPTEGDLTYINSQDRNLTTKAKLTAYVEYANQFEDVTSSFIGQFKQLFLTVVVPEIPLWYEDPFNKKD